MLLIAVCLFASVYSALGMRTVYYRDGQVCDACSDGYVPYKDTYTPDEVGKKVVYGTEQRIISRPSSSSSYVVNRAGYSDRNLFIDFTYSLSLKLLIPSFACLFQKDFIFPFLI